MCIAVGDPGRFEIPLISLTHPHFCVCPKPESEFPSAYAMVFSCVQWFEVKDNCALCQCGWNCLLVNFFLIPSKLGLHDRFHGWSKIILSFWSIDLTPSFLYNLHTYYKRYYQAESVKILVWTCAGFPFSRTYRNFMFDMCFHQNKRELMDFFTLKLDN